MSDQIESDTKTESTEFQQEMSRMRQSKRSSSSPLSEFWEYLRIRKKWWLAPVILALLVVGALVTLGGTAAAPVIYTLF